MGPLESKALLEVLKDPLEFRGLTAEYFAEVHDEFPTEFDLLVGQSALERPYGQKRLTAAEAYYAAIHPDFASNAYMEANRTAMNLWVLDCIQRGDEVSLTDCQPDAIKLVGEPFVRLQQFIADALPAPDDVQLARVMLTIADLGKSKKVAERMMELTCEVYADHDRLLIDVLRHPIAGPELTPSYWALPEEAKEKALKIFGTGMHLPQFMQAENLPYHLVEFQQLDPELQKIGHVVSILDVAGAAGDSVQNGSVTLNLNTFISFEQAVAAIDFRGDITLDTRQIARDSYDHYLASVGQYFDLDVTVPVDRALARLARMGRATASSDVLVTELRAVYERRLGSNTQALLVDFLNQDGFEPGDLWLEYSPALSNETKKSMGLHGVDSETAVTIALTTLARLTAEARSQFDFSDADGPVNFVMGDVVRAAEGNPRLLLNGAVEVTPINNIEAKIGMRVTDRLDLSALPTLETLADLNFAEGNTMFVGYGGGADPITAAVVARLMGQTEAAVVSVWGSSENPPINATQLSERVFKASPETVLPDLRYFDDLVAGAGLESYIITQTRPFLPIADELAVVADDFGGVRNLVGVDTGGDLLARPTGEILASRDHTTFMGLTELARQLGVATNLSIVVAPGIDSPPNALDVLQNASASSFDLRPYADEIIDFCAELGLPSADPNRYSTTLPTFLGALAWAEGLMELPMPVENVLDRENTWVPFAVVEPSMSKLVAMQAEDLRRALDL